MVPERVVVTGLGTVNALAGDAIGFAAALRAGACGMATVEPAPGEPGGPRVMAPVAGFSWQEDLERHRERLPDCVDRARRILRNNSGSARLSAAAAFQALGGSGLLPAASGSERIGIVVAGSNLQQRDVWDNLRRQVEGRAVNPRYGLSFLDSGQVGCLGEIFGLRGFGYSVGAASASGTMALFQAWHWLRSGLLDGCLVVGANSDLSPLELEGFELLGALGGAGWEDRPEQACRPFDRGHAGFLWGQGSGALLLERRESALARGAPLRGELLGAAVAMDGNHLPDSSTEGEVRAMRGALEAAGLTPRDVDYVNAHATSTPLGDATECAALRTLFGSRAGTVRVNATKGLIGHCLSAAGVVETVACLLQLEGGFLHPNRNLIEPIDPVLGFVGGQAEPASPRVALKNGFGFGGFNSSLVLGCGET